MSDTASRFQLPTEGVVPAEELESILHARAVLGADAEPGVIQAFLDRTGLAIDARVDSRLSQSAAPARGRASDQSSLALAIASLVVGIPLTAIATQFGHASALIVCVVWAAIAIVNVSYVRRP
jgi:hypothetical protein